MGEVRGTVDNAPTQSWRRWWHRRVAKPHLIATFLFLLLLFAVTATYLTQSYRGWMSEQRDLLGRTASLLAATVEPILLSSRLALLNAVALAEGEFDDDTLAEVQTVLETIQETVPFVTVATLVDTDGLVLAASRPEAVGTTPISQAIIQANMPVGDEMLIRGPMNGPVSGQRILALNMRYDDGNGDALGLVTIGLDTARLNEVFAASLYAGADVMLFTHDAFLLVHQPAGPIELGRAYPQAPLFQSMVGDAGFYTGTNPATGADRTVAYARSPGSGIVTAVGIDKALLFRQWALGNLSVVALALLVGLGAVGIMAVSQTALATKQRALEQARALERARLEFLGHVSHELRTPLNAILGFGDMIRTGIAGTVSPAALRYNDHILAAGQHLLRVVNDVLDYTRLEAGILTVDRGPLELRQIVDDAWMMVPRDDGGVELEVAVPASLTVWGDQRLVCQVFINLFANAVRHADGITRIRVVASQEATGAILVAVNNDGAPIPPERLEGLFTLFASSNPFVRSGSQGAGLGLAICREIMRRHGGKIDVASAPEDGTTITLRFPPR